MIASIRSTDTNEHKSHHSNTKSLWPAQVATATQPVDSGGTEAPDTLISPTTTRSPHELLELTEPALELIEAGAASSLESNSTGAHEGPSHDASASLPQLSKHQAPTSLHGSVPSGRIAAVACPTAIAHEHICMLRELANSIPNSNGKWEHIQSVYRTHYPDLPLSNNALRCRLKEKPRRATPSPMSVAIAPTRKRKETSCSSCRQRKKRCGDLTRNP